MRPTPILRAAAAVAATIFLSLVVALGLAASPATATDNPNAGTLDTSVTTLDKTNSDATDDQCTGDKCKRIPWCPPPGKPLLGITTESPVILGDDTTECVKMPKVDYKCCESDESGTANVHIVVDNPNPFKIKFKVQLGDAAPQIKWVVGQAKTKFVFKGVANGKYWLTVSVWAGEAGWCKIKPQLINVNCAPPSPIQSPSPSVSPTLSPAPSQSISPAGQLPQTGTPVGGIATVGAGAVAVGAVALLAARRRRNIGHATISE